MGAWSKEAVETFLDQQEQLFDEPVAENEEEAEDFLTEWFAVEADTLEDVREFLDQEGLDVEELSDEELEEQSEVFALPSGRYLIVIG